MKFIAVTGQTGQEFFDRSYKAGALSFLRKPVLIEELKSSIENALRKCHYLMPEATGPVMEVYLERVGAKDKLPLTPRQQKVAELVAEGYTSAEIAEQWNISERTVEKHREHILERAKFRNTAQLRHEMKDRGQ